MKLPGHRVISACGAGAFLLATAALTFAGGSADDHDHDDNALRYFGFVKDTSGKVVAGARVGAEVKGMGTFFANTDATGAYRIPVPRIGQAALPENVRISCSKEGYKQSRTMVRSSLAKKPLVAVEVECTLQGVPAK